MAGCCAPLATAPWPTRFTLRGKGREPWGAVEQLVQRAGGLGMASRRAPGAAATRPMGCLRRVEHEHREGRWVVVQRAGGLVMAEGLMMAPLAPLHPNLCGLLCAAGWETNHGEARWQLTQLPSEHAYPRRASGKQLGGCEVGVQACS